MHSLKLGGWLLASLGALAALQACGGAGGTTPDVPAPSAGQGGLTLSVAGGRDGGLAHAWVTVQGVALSTDAGAPYVAGDAAWVTRTLAAPVTLDLVGDTLGNGQFAGLLRGVAVPPGTYPQVRLLLSGPGQALTESATALGLHWNDEVRYVDAAGVTRAVPLELPSTAQGLRLSTQVSVVAGTQTYAVTEFDAATALVRRAGPDGLARFTLRPRLPGYDQEVTGAIIGAIDGQDVCGVGSTAADCISSLEVVALGTSRDGLSRSAVRATRPATAAAAASASRQISYVLYPLPYASSFDVLVQGRGMQPILVRQVAVSTAGLLGAVPVVVGSASAPLLPVKDSRTRSLALQAPAAQPGGLAAFTQTLDDGIARELLQVGTDPATGLGSTVARLPATPWQVATWSADGLAFAAQTPAAGLGAYGSIWRGRSTDQAQAGPAVAATDAGWTAPTLALAQGLAAGGQLSVQLSGSTGGADRAELVIANPGGVVVVLDVSSLLPAGGTQAVAVPWGVAGSDAGAAVYTASVRSWQQADPLASLKWSEAVNVADLRKTATGSLALSWPR